MPKSLSLSDSVFRGLPAYGNDTGPAFQVSPSYPALCVQDAASSLACPAARPSPPPPAGPWRTPQSDIKIYSTGQLHSQQPLNRLLTCQPNQPPTHILLLTFSVPRHTHLPLYEAEIAQSLSAETMQSSLNVPQLDSVSHGLLTASPCPINSMLGKPLMGVVIGN